MTQTKDLPRWIWLWLALSPVLILSLGRLLTNDLATYSKFFHGEFGIIENITVLLLFPAIYLAIKCAHRFWKEGMKPIGILLIIYALGCFYIGGEELSWGQHFFKWETPEYFLENNKQGETNLHNLYGSHRGLHKLLLVLGMTVGGVLVPLLALFINLTYKPARNAILWLIPTLVCLPTAVTLAISYFYSKIIKWTGIQFDYLAFNNLGFEIPEFVELYISIFLLLYVVSLSKRLSQVEHLQDKSLTIGPN